MKNEEEKTLKKSWKNWTARSTCNSRLAGKIRLSVKSHLARNLTQRAGQA